MIVGAGGARVLLYHREEAPGDHVSNDIILRSLGLSQMVARCVCVGGGEELCRTDSGWGGEGRGAEQRGEEIRGEGNGSIDVHFP